MKNLLLAALLAVVVSPVIQQGNNPDPGDNHGTPSNPSAPHCAPGERTCGGPGTIR